MSGERPINETEMKLQKELDDIAKHPPANCSVEPDNDDIFHWKATISGLVDPLFLGGIFRLDIKFPTDYPLKPPKVRFTTKMYHPNIDENGNVWMDILNEWNNYSDVDKSASKDHDMCPKAAKLYVEDRNAYDERVKAYTILHAE